MAPGGRPPFELDAVVLEEDTHRVLAAAPDITPPPEDLSTIVHAMSTMSPALPGSVMIERGAPLALHAIVHDLDREPSWRELWIEQALHSVLLVVRERHIRSLGLPLLGTVHGRMGLERSVAVLRRVLRGGDPGPLARLWVLAPQCVLDKVANRLAEDEQPDPTSL